jgi:signal transduction histidine kinase
MNDRPLLVVLRRSFRPDDIQRALAVEETLAHVRLVLAAVSLAAVVPLHFDRDVHVIGLTALALAYAFGVVVALRTGRVRRPLHVAGLHAGDIAVATLLTADTGGAASPYSTIYLFALLAAGYRYGGFEVGVTCAISAAAMLAHALATNLLGWLGAPDPPLVALRLAYLTAGAVLIGYMADVERRQRERTKTANRFLSVVGTHSSIVTAVQALMTELLEFVSASHLVLAIDEESREYATLWHAERAEGDASRHVVTVSQDRRWSVPQYLFPLPDAVGGLLVVRSGTRTGGRGHSVATVGHDGYDVAADVPIQPLLDTPVPWQRALVLCYSAAHGMTARLFLFLPAGVRASRTDLRDVQAIMREVGPAVVNLYLQRRLQSRSAVVERTRISRELHDGVIQGLIGVEMQLEVTRREADGKVPQALTDELTHIQKIIGQEVLNVRDLMQMLKPMDVDAARLVEHLASTVEQFRQRTGIKATFACGVDEIDLSPRVCREIASIVQEALANVRKHSEATGVQVRLDTEDGDWRVTVDDNGRGLDFEGFLSHQDIEAQRKGPVLIRDRVRAINGRLGIHSLPGFGTKIEITIPRKLHG